MRRDERIADEMQPHGPILSRLRFLKWVIILFNSSLQPTLFAEHSLPSLGGTVLLA